MSRCQTFWNHERVRETSRGLMNVLQPPRADQMPAPDNRQLPVHTLQNLTRRTLMSAALQMQLCTNACRPNTIAASGAASCHALNRLAPNRNLCQLSVGAERDHPYTCQMLHMSISLFMPWKLSWHGQGRVGHGHPN